MCATSCEGMIWQAVSVFRNGHTSTNNFVGNTNTPICLIPPGVSAKAKHDACDQGVSDALGWLKLTPRNSLHHVRDALVQPATVALVDSLAESLNLWRATSVAYVPKAAVRFALG